VSDALFGPYVLGVELASMLLLAALIGARHIASQPDEAPAAGETATGGAADDPTGSATAAQARTEAEEAGS